MYDLARQWEVLHPMMCNHREGTVMVVKRSVTAEEKRFPRGRSDLCGSGSVTSCALCGPLPFILSVKHRWGEQAPCVRYHI